MNYTNPIISGFYPDPSICRVKDDFYMITSTFEYFPGVPIFHSRDLVNWEQIGHCLTTREQLNLGNMHSSGGIFAPTLRYHKGRFYMITTNVSYKGNFFVTAEKPEGPWSDPVWLPEWPGIDPSLFFDEDGSVYITGTAGNDREETGIYQAQIAIETGKLISERKLIWKGTGGAYPEGPHLYKKDSQYYLMISEGGTEYGHMLTIARSQFPSGPFKSNPSNPILSHRSKKSPIQGTGHADLIQFTDGSWWGVFLAYRPIGYFPKHHLGREAFLSPVEWTEDGWPIFGADGIVNSQMTAPHLQIAQKLNKNVDDHFANSSLDIEWNHRGNPDTTSYLFGTDSEGLELIGKESNLSDNKASTFLGRRQAHFDCDISTLMEFHPNDNEEAGITVFANEQFHYDLALTKENGQSKIILRKTVGSISIIEKTLDYSFESVVFKVKSDQHEYHFSITNPSGVTTELGKGECGFLSKEVAGGFTGVYFGLFATGNGNKCKSSARFNWFKYYGRQSLANI